ncbi:hypothetical protein ASG12_00075 [Williamsia sp. Leaf354]|nr:hypothetical protein ASG12_00075 [Williamsia sp. Leaf354]
MSDHTHHGELPYAAKPKSPNTAASTARCQMKMPYDQRPSVCIIVESSRRWRWSPRTIGANSPKATAAPSTVLVANSALDTAARPVGPAIGVHASAYATTASAPMMRRSAAMRRGHDPVSSPSLTLSARTMPATNQPRWPGSQLSTATPGASGSVEASQGHARHATAAATSTGDRHRARSPRSRATDTAITGSRR